MRYLASPLPLFRLPLVRRALSRIPLFRFASFALLFVAVGLAPAAAQTKPASSGSGATIAIGDVVPIKYTPDKVGIPTFANKGLPAGVTPEFSRDVIYQDLEWFGDFAKSKNDQRVLDETEARDVRSGQVDYVEWGRQDCNYVLKGEVSSEGGLLTAEVRFYSVLQGERVLGLRYRGYPADSARKLAHRISDDVIKAVRKVPVGIANTQILFVSRRGGTHKEIWVMDADGQNQRQLTKDNSTNLTPCWGLNGTEIYYTTYKDTNPDLCAMQLGTGKWWFISRRPGQNYCPDWNATAGRIALTLDRDGNSEIYTMDRTGRDATLRRLTMVAAIDTSPSWSPDGSRIVFNSARSSTPQIYVMDANGENERRLTLQGRYNVSPSWSPKGDRIAFVGQDQGGFDIFTMNPDGTGWIQLTDQKGNSEDPTWAPDGEHIVFWSDRSGSHQIYIMRAKDGQNVRQLTREGTNESPAWGPAPPY